MKIAVTTVDTWPHKRKDFAKIVFTAENREDGLELRKLYAEFVGADFADKDNYVDLDDDRPEFGDNGEVKKLTMILGGDRGRKRRELLEALPPDFALKGTYLFNERLRTGIPGGVPDSE